MGRWQSFDCVFENDVRDAVALYLDASEDVSLITRMIEKIWPSLREDCLQEFCVDSDAKEAVGEKLAGDEALLWMISDRLDIALFVLDAECRMLRINAAAKILLQEEKILRRGRGGLFGVTEADTTALRTAVAAQSALTTGSDLPTDHESVVFLEGSEDRKVPVALSGFVYKGTPTNYVVAMLPMPPDSGRVEMVGRGMGLTAVEARVASLIQLGLSNREAAHRAGIREQSFNTYAKRALSKLNVSSRSEMAQLLTWQAAGGRKS
jgi:DNA-binding CsgD family transcriptional regulator